MTHTHFFLTGWVDLEQQQRPTEYLPPVGSEARSDTIANDILSVVLTDLRTGRTDNPSSLPLKPRHSGKHLSFDGKTIR
jgi:hypothetical protein